MNCSLKMKRSDWRFQNWGFKVNLWFLGFIFVEVLILARKIAFYKLKRLSVWYWKEESLIFQSCKSIMVAQKNLLAEIFCIFQHILTQNPTNQCSPLFWFFQTIWKTIAKSINRGLYGIISARKWFQILLHSKFF